ncbi:UNVERIFIED_CONTAM: hypothetical protein Sradi_3789100 [Sesamum radiatum]|uniref:RNase H type-1 domain-containing protein n=1 Tax=Sesamum radiatum TaxID=300843 RepID=A0AAW2PZR7_SESRA
MVELTEEQETEVREGWMLHVDGSSNANNRDGGILLQGPNGVEIEVAVRLSFPTTNNEAEYKALILGLELEQEAGARDLEVYTDSQLVAMQIEGAYETRERFFILYLKKAKEMIAKFDRCAIQQIPRCENDKANALSKFGAIIAGIKDRRITMMIKEKVMIDEIIEIETIGNQESWMDEITRFLRDGVEPTDPMVAKRIKFKANRFTLVDYQLYKRTVDGPLLKCLDNERVQYVMREVHKGSCGNH